MTVATDRQWWPSPFGAEDQLGCLNYCTEEKRVEALSLVREGRVYDLGHELHEGVPVFPGRYFRQTLVTTAHHANTEGGLGDNNVNWVIEQISGTMQLGTHIDALSHLQIGDRGYNGWKVTELADAAGVKRLGAETIPQIVTRGWLVDVSGRSPGPGYEVADWLVNHRVALTGCDTWSYGPVPAENRDRPFDVPQMLNVKHGVFIVENLDTSELAADGVGEFALILTHPKLRGATGAWTSPIALN